MRWDDITYLSCRAPTCLTLQWGSSSWRQTCSLEVLWDILALKRRRKICCANQKLISENFSYGCRSSSRDRSLMKPAPLRCLWRSSEWKLSCCSRMELMLLSCQLRFHWVTSGCNFLKGSSWSFQSVEIVQLTLGRFTAFFAVSVSLGVWTVMLALQRWLLLE